VRVLAGRPLIAHSVAAALAAPSLGRVIVDTDDAEIAGVAREAGAEVPFLRPAELATDTARVIEATFHLLRRLEAEQGYRPAYVMLLQPTSPLRTSADIEGAVRLAMERDADAVVSVCPVREHPFLFKTLDAEGRLHPFVRDGRVEAGRQAWPEVYRLNGAIYLVRRETLLETRSWCPEGVLAYAMPAARSLDIDVPEDWVAAERAMAAGLGG
jgi:CMP-N-acetylneuraminic acid synthetase